jgi:hypothetical protein
VIPEIVVAHRPRKKQPGNFRLYEATAVQDALDDFTRDLSVRDVIESSLVEVYRLVPVARYVVGYDEPPHVRLAHKEEVPVQATWVYYESDGGKGGPALLLPPDTLDSAKADLVVFPENDDKPNTVRDVPKRAEGGGHTWRAEK